MLALLAGWSAKPPNVCAADSAPTVDAKTLAEATQIAGEF
jgi:hypothetical protein